MLFTCFNGIQPVKTASLSSQVLFGINQRNKTEAKSAVFFCQFGVVAAWKTSKQSQFTFNYKNGQ